jgi:hypothetical protein
MREISWSILAHGETQALRQSPLCAPFGHQVFDAAIPNADIIKLVDHCGHERLRSAFHPSRTFAIGVNPSPETRRLCRYRHGLPRRSLEPESNARFHGRTQALLAFATRPMSAFSITESKNVGNLGIRFGAIAGKPENHSGSDFNLTVPPKQSPAGAPQPWGRPIPCTRGPQTHHRCRGCSPAVARSRLPS